MAKNTHTQSLYKNMKQTQGCKETRVSVWVIAKIVADYIAKNSDSTEKSTTKNLNSKSAVKLGKSHNRPEVYPPESKHLDNQ